MSQPISVLLVEDNRIEAHQTQHMLATAADGTFEVECVDNLKAALERLAQGGIDIVLLDLNLPDSRGEATFEKLYAECPLVPIVVLTGEYDEEIGPSTVSKGAQDYLVKQRVGGTSLAHVLRYALARHQAQLEKLKSFQIRKSGRVLGFLGAKGGVGTTTTALNVAVALAMRGKSVILVEMRPSFGTLAFHVNQQPAKNLRTLLDLPPERIGRTELNAVLCEGPAGVWILFGPKDGDAAFREIEPRQADAIVNGLAQMAEYVILDLGTQPSGAMRAAVNLCHFAAVVTEREPGSVRAGRVLVKLLQDWGSRGNLQGGVFLVGSVVVNRTIYSNYMMPAAEVQSLMGCEIVGMVPFGAPDNLRALTECVPLALLQPDNDTAISYVEIANRLSTDKLTGFRSGSESS